MIDEQYYLMLMGFVLGQDNPEANISNLTNFDDVDLLVQNTYNIEIPAGTPMDEAFRMICEARVNEDPFK